MASRKRGRGDSKTVVFAADCTREGEERESAAHLRAVPVMMYGFGDAAPDEQDPETVAVVDELLCEYLRFVAREGASVAAGGKIGVDEALFVLRKDKKKCVRVLAGKERAAMRSRFSPQGLEGSESGKVGLTAVLFRASQYDRVRELIATHKMIETQKRAFKYQRAKLFFCAITHAPTRVCGEGNNRRLGPRAHGAKEHLVKTAASFGGLEEQQRDSVCRELLVGHADGGVQHRLHLLGVHLQFGVGVHVRVAHLLSGTEFLRDTGECWRVCNAGPVVAYRGQLSIVGQRALALFFQLMGALRGLAGRKRAQALCDAQIHLGSAGQLGRSLGQCSFLVRRGSAKIAHGGLRVIQRSGHVGNLQSVLVATRLQRCALRMGTFHVGQRERKLALLWWRLPSKFLGAKKKGGTDSTALQLEANLIHATLLDIHVALQGSAAQTKKTRSKTTASKKNPKQSYLAASRAWCCLMSASMWARRKSNGNKSTLIGDCAQPPAEPRATAREHGAVQSLQPAPQW